MIPLIILFLQVVSQEEKSKQRMKIIGTKRTDEAASEIFSCDILYFVCICCYNNRKNYTAAESVEKRRGMMGVTEIIIFAAELVGVSAFAVSGALAAMEKDMDLFGVCALGIVTAVGGGVFRDILLGIVPPIMFLKPIYAAVAFLVSLAAFCVVFFGGRTNERKRKIVSGVIEVSDAIGLAVFTVSGVVVAQSTEYFRNAFLAVFVGMVTGIGGGILRDVLCVRLPGVFVKRIYAVASMVGALLYYLLDNAVEGKALPLSAGIGSIVAIRLAAWRYRWSLPKVKPPIGNEK